jgi:hypothetical protein
MTKRYVGYYNLDGQEFRLTTKAKSESSAHQRMISGLSKRLNLSRRALQYHFNGERDNYLIQEDAVYDDLRERSI